MVAGAAGAPANFAEGGFGGCCGVTSAKDERGTGQGWPMERKNSPQTRELLQGL